MKVLLISPLPPPNGGIANWSSIILKYGSAVNDNIITLDTAPKKRMTEGRGIFDRVVGSGIDMLKKRKILKHFLVSDRPDVIHITTSGSLSVLRDLCFMRLAKRFGIPVVYHLHFGRAAELAHSQSFIGKAFSCALKESAVVIALNKTTLDAIAGEYPNVNTAVVPNPIDLRKLPQHSAVSKKAVVFVGWVIPTKGVEELLKAWEKIECDFPNHTLLFVGQSEPDYIGHLKKENASQNVCFMGEQSNSDAVKTVSDCEVFVLPSHFEGFPYSVLEAMAVGTAVIATDVGAIPEMLSDDCGIIVEKKNVDALADAIRTLLTDGALREKLSLNARKKVEDLFSVEKVYAEYKSLWEQVSRKGKSEEKL